MEISTKSEDNETRLNGEVEDLERNFEYLVAISDYDATDENQLSFKRGEQIRVVERVNEYWLWALIDGSSGYIPSNHVEDPEKLEEKEKWQDEEYFQSYCHMRLHLEMLGDVARTIAYRNAIVENVSLVNGKTVLDVGCGSGILSMFCARDGHAKRVYAVEASILAEHLYDVLKENNLNDTILVVKGRMEEISLPEKVDLIISEWMGTFLLFEYMIDSIIYARDRYLKHDGIIWPTCAQLFIVPCMLSKVYEEKIGVWKQQYGFSFSSLQSKAIQDFFSRPIIDYDLESENCLCNAQSIVYFNMKTLQVAELETWSSKFTFNIKKTGILHGFGSWFDIQFHSTDLQTQEVENALNMVTLSTGPNAPKTHWKNAIFMFNEPVTVEKGYTVKGMVKVKRNEDFRRHMTISFDVGITNSSGESVKNIAKEFKLWR